MIPQNLNTLNYVYELFEFNDDTLEQEIYDSLEFLKRYNIIIKEVDFESETLDQLLDDIRSYIENSPYAFDLETLIKDLRYHFQTLENREQDFEDDHLV